MSSDGAASDILARSQRLHQELLAKRLASARSRHEVALARLQQVIASTQPNGHTHAEGWREILEARFVEADALSEYIAALRAYSESPAPLQVIKH